MRVEREESSRSTVFRFESPQEYADTVQRECRPRENGSWSNGETWAQAVDRARRGNLDLVPAAEKLVDQISFDAQRDSPQWAQSVAGAFPMVADYLTGRPDCMRRRMVQSNDRAPIRVYVELTSSAGVDAKDLLKRGTAILALCLLLNRERSVELHAVVGLNVGQKGAGFVDVHVGSSPLDIALACNAMTSVGFSRSMGYEFLSHRAETQCGGGWAWNLYPSDDRTRAEYVKRMRQAFGASETDVIIPPIFLTDPSVTDPVGFVKRSLDEALAVEAQAGE